MKGELVRHPLEPVYDSCSKVLLLGTMPSPRSREMGFYYGHPRNRFWPVLASLFQEPVPDGPEARRAFCLKHHIALWDVLSSCVIEGAGDSTIRQPVANPIGNLLDEVPIRAVFTTGQKAYALYTRHCLPKTGVKAVALPSTSPANCAVSMERLIQAYRQILPWCQKEEI